MKDQLFPKKRLLPAGMLVLAVLLLVSCLKDEFGGVLISTQKEVSIYPVAQQTVGVGFFARRTWTAASSADWITLEPDHGESGTNTLVITTNEINRTKAERTALVTITSDGQQQTFTLHQSGEYAIFDNNQLDMPSEGGVLDVTFETNIPDSLKLYVSTSLADRLVDLRRQQQSRTRAQEYTGTLSWLRLLPNDSVGVRTGFLLLSMLTPEGYRLDLDTLHVSQAAVDSTSSK